MKITEIEDQLNLRIPSRVDEIFHPSFQTQNTRVFVKRDDLIHPMISGNKWRKLKYNIEFYLNQNYRGIVSFGGAYSNHLYALSTACYHLSIPFVALIRGDGFDPENQTLVQLKEQGTKMIFVSRSAYREKENSLEVQKYLSQYQNHYLIPEGGSSDLAIAGLLEMCDELDWSMIDHLFVSAGTGATAGGILNFMDRYNTQAKLHVVSALKGGFMKTEVLKYAGLSHSQSLIVYDDFHFGGYAKMPMELIDFSNEFTDKTNLPLDLIYNAKTMYAMSTVISNGEIGTNSNVLFVNTGGRR